jgi:hypothetical protein
MPNKLCRSQQPISTQEPNQKVQLSIYDSNRFDQAKNQAPAQAIVQEPTNNTSYYYLLWIWSLLF